MILHNVIFAVLSERTRACVMGVECGLLCRGQGGGKSPGTVTNSYYCSYYKCSVKISTPVNSLFYKEFKKEYQQQPGVLGIQRYTGSLFYFR